MNGPPQKYYFEVTWGVTLHSKIWQALKAANLSCSHIFITVGRPENINMKFNSTTTVHSLMNSNTTLNYSTSFARVCKLSW